MLNYTKIAGAPYVIENYISSSYTLPSTVSIIEYDSELYVFSLFDLLIVYLYSQVAFRSKNLVRYTEYR